MTIIQLKNKFISVPTEWNDLSAGQLLEVMLTFENRKYNEDRMILKLLKIILDINYYQWLRLKPADIEEYIYLVGFLLDKTAGLTKQLLPFYHDLHGPSDECGNLLMGEFAFSEHYFMQWQEKRDDVQLLNHLMAVLYRPAKKRYDFEKNPDGDCRIPFNENISAYYAKDIIARWPHHVKLAIATWYAGCRQKLVDNNPEVFGGQGEAAKYGLISIIRNIAKEGTHGDFESVEKKSVSLMMIELNEVVEEGRRIEQQLKSK